MKQAAAMMEGKTKEKLQGQGSGHRYKLPNSNVTYQASEEDEPPAWRTGNLATSISSMAIQGSGGVRGFFGTNVEYAPYLELGTDDMEPRPFLQPTLNENEEKAAEILTAL